jgi:hypothetical protein
MDLGCLVEWRELNKDFRVNCDASYGRDQGPRTTVACPILLCQVFHRTAESFVDQLVLMSSLTPQTITTPSGQAVTI